MLARPAVLIGGALVAAALGVSRVAEGESGPQPLVAAELATPDGGKATLAAALKGRPTLISLWATWCESCAAEFGALGKLSTKAAEKGAYVVAISEGEAPETVRTFIRARGLNYPQLVDEKFIVADSVNQRSLPATLVIDRKGRVVFKGATLDRAALEALDRAIAQ